MTTLKSLTLEQRTQIGQYYKDGLTAKAIAPLYGLKQGDVNNAITFLRKNGVQIPFKNKRVEKKVKTPELLVLPEVKTAVKKMVAKRKYANSEKREAYRIYRTNGKTGVNEIMSTFEVTKNMAYYLIQQGRTLSGVKGKVRVAHVSTPSRRIEGDNVGFFVLGAIATLLVQSIF